MKLIQPDRNRCQCEITTYEPWHFGGCPYQVERCKNEPTVIITEKTKNKDHKKGSMSLCDSCLKQAKKKLGEKNFTIKKIVIDG
jgi:hypothetical protein